MYEDRASGARDDRPGLAACHKALRADGTVGYLNSRNFREAGSLVLGQVVLEREIGLKVLTGHGAAIDTTTASRALTFAIFAALSEYERALISERTTAGLASARARGRHGGRPYKLTPAKLRIAAAVMRQPETHVGDLCVELGISRQALCRHVSPTGEIRLLATSSARSR